MKTIWIALIAIVILVAGSIIVSATISDNKISEKQINRPNTLVTENSATISTKNCGCGSSSCEGTCGGSCGVVSCGCGR